MRDYQEYLRVTEVLGEYHRQVRMLQVEAALEAGFITEEEADNWPGAGVSLRLAFNRWLDQREEDGEDAQIRGINAMAQSAIAKVEGKEDK